MEVLVSGLASANPPGAIRIDTNDPMRAERRATLVLLAGGLAEGDPIPDFRLPMINRCEEGDCTTEPECFQHYDPQWGQMPILIAFYTSW